MLRLCTVAMLAIGAAEGETSATPACLDAACAVQTGDESEAFASLQLRRGETAAMATSQVGEEPDPEWYDALSMAPEHLAAVLQASARADAHPDRGDGGRDLIAAGAQASPQACEGCEFRGPVDSEEFREPPRLCASKGRLEVTLEVVPGWLSFPAAGVRAMTRLYNGGYPGPTLCFRRGDKVVVHLVNKLGEDWSDERKFQRREGQATPAQPAGVPFDSVEYQDVGQEQGSPSRMAAHMNNLHRPNTTNLHTHGLHVSQRVGQDDILRTVVHPGGRVTYTYEIPPNHAAGVAWYHPHLHGSIMSQLGGGLAGVLLVEDSPGEVPRYLEKARQVIAAVQELAWGYFGPKSSRYSPEDLFKGCFPFGSNFTVGCALEARQGLIANLSGDALWRLQYRKGFGYGPGQRPPQHDFLAVNGQYKPTLKVKTGEWLRVHLAFAATNHPLNLVLVDEPDQEHAAQGCSMDLLGKDGVFVSPAPRRISRGVWLPPGGRCEVLIRCHRPGKYSIRNNMTYVGTPQDPGLPWGGFPTLPQYSYAGGLDRQVIFYLHAIGKPKEERAPEVFRPARPSYLNDLRGLSNDSLASWDVPPTVNWDNNKSIELPVKLLTDDKKTFTLLFEVGFVGNKDWDNRTEKWFDQRPQRFQINGMTFNVDHPQASIPVGSVLQMNVLGLGQHVFHMHTYPVQIQSFGRPDYEAFWGGYFQVGDWHDTLALFDQKFDVFAEELNSVWSVLTRFTTDCFAGAAIVHCHVIFHEDLGMLSLFDVTGRDYTRTPGLRDAGVFAEPPPQCLRKHSRCARPRCASYEYKGDQN